MSARGAGLSKVRLKRLSNAMSGYVERGEFAGAVTLIARRGAVHVEAHGVRDVASDAPMTRDTIFRIASMTKPIAAAAAMMLVEEARLRLDDPVDRWLPELADRRVLKRVDGPLDDTVPATRAITLRDLLAMRAGYGMVAAPESAPINRARAELRIEAGPNPPPFAPDETLRRFATLPLAHQPGEQWLYHSAYDILSVLIARAAGKSFEDFLAERIFGPLGMTDTSFAIPKSRRKRLAGAYQGDATSGGLTELDDDGAAFPSGSAGLVSTVDDYLAFAQMMLNHGRHGRTRLLARPTVTLMTTDQITPEQKAASPAFPGFWESWGWGFGVAPITRRDAIAASPGAYGWGGGFGTDWRNDPGEDIVAMLMIQRLYDSVVGSIQSDFWTLAYQAIDD